jgi:hypothetical protein
LGGLYDELSFEEAAALGFTDATMDRHWREKIVPAVDAAVDRINGHIARLQERGEARESPLFPNSRGPTLAQLNGRIVTRRADVLSWRA